jgi:hypothetical protein
MDFELEDTLTRLGDHDVRVKSSFLDWGHIRNTILTLVIKFMTNLLTYVHILKI